MAVSQQYSLKWNNYVNHLSLAFGNLRNEDDLVDVTLWCDGKSIKAHKILLSACSSYFKEIFKESPHPHPVIVFKFIKFEDLQAIIEFMYQGEVNIQQSALQSFLQTAELLSVQGLTSDDKNPTKQKTTIKSEPHVEEQHHIVKTIPITAVRNIAISSAPQQTLELQTAGNNVTIPMVQPQTQQITVSTSSSGIRVSSAKKRKITFTADESADESALYETDNVDFSIAKDEKISTSPTAEVQFIAPNTVENLDFIDVTETKPLTDTSLQQQQTSQLTGTSQDATTQASQYTSEYEILAESDIEKYEQSGANEGSVSVDIEGQTYTIQEKPIHKTKEPQDTSKWTECQFCKMVITTVNLWRHIRTQHTPQPPRKCDLCNKNFKNKYSLREHIRISHEQKQIKGSTNGVNTSTAVTLTITKKE